MKDNMQNAFVPYVVEHTPQGDKTTDMFTRLLQERIVYCVGPVNEQLSQIVTAALLFLDSLSSKDITLYVSSPGGAVSDGLAIIDTMNFLNSDVKVVGMGMCASMGAAILSAGTKGKRFILENTEVMIHQIRTSGGGGVNTQTDTNDDSIRGNMLNNRLIRILAHNCGQTFENMKRLMNYGDRFMFGDEACAITYDIDHGNKPLNAIELGIVDAILKKNKVK
jgi:ATP-dependent Clp protease, protease subunit